MVLILFPAMSLYEQSIITIILMGLCTASVVTAAGYFPVFSSFAFPIFTALILRWLFMPGQYWLNYVMGLLLLIFSLVLTRSSLEFFSSFKRSYLIGKEKSSLNQKLEVALQEAQTSSLVKSRLVAAAGHDLSQPMQSINYNIETLCRRTLDEESQQLLQKIQKSSDTLSEQLGEILEISRIDSGDIIPRMTSVNLNNIINLVYGEFKEQANSKNLKFVMDIPDDILVMGDENLSEELFVI